MTTQDLLEDIITLAVDVTTDTPHDAFVEFSGHVMSATLYIHLGGWRPSKDANIFLTTYINEDYGIDDLKEMKSTLQDLLGQN